MGSCSRQRSNPEVLSGFESLSVPAAGHSRKSLLAHWMMVSAILSLTVYRRALV